MKPLRLLVVDDIDASRQSLAELALQLGHTVVTAASGAEAIERCGAGDIDLVLLDLFMPSMDGFEVTRRLRQTPSGRWLPVIVISGLEGEAPFIEALSHGADDYLSRPVSRPLLQAKLAHYARVLELQDRMTHAALLQRSSQDSVRDALLTLGPDGRVVDANRTAAQWFGSGRREALLGRTTEALLGHGLDRLAASATVNVQRNGGETFEAEVQLSPWTTAEGRHHTVVVRDLTEQRLVERMKDEFLATVSHELRTPLTSVVASVGILASGALGPLPPAMQSFLDVARRNGERLSRLIDDILDLTRLEGRRMPLDLRDQGLRALVEDALRTAQPLAQSAGVTLKSEVLSPDGTEAHAAVDAQRLGQVLGNLLSNAIRHSPGGTTVGVQLAARDQHVTITVSDQGGGVAPELRRRLFQKFATREGNVRHAASGAGLGLYISRMLVEGMGGQLTLTASSPAGSSFCVTLPRTGARTVRGRPRVLHIERDFQVRERVQRWLSPFWDVDSRARLGAADTHPDRPPPVAVIGNPVSQGPVDRFCEALLALAGDAPVLLLSDSFDDRTLASERWTCLPLQSVDAERLCGQLQQLIAAPQE